MFNSIRAAMPAAVLMTFAACGGGGSNGSASTGGNTSAPCPDPTRIDPDTVIQGSLATTDCSVARLFPSETGDNSLLDQYIVTLPAAGEFTIRMESQDFDAFLALLDADATAAPIAEDDDGAGNLDALITIELDAGSYIIIANSSTITAVTGSYTLTTSYRPFSWNSTSQDGAPDMRTEHSAIWSDAEMIVWGGNDGNAIAKQTGARYDVLTDSWNATDTMGAPQARYGHSSVWTGTEMLVWGGFSGAFDFVTLGDGAGYSPQSDSWSAITNTDSPAPRVGHSTVWTGSEMIVWGGFSCLGCANAELATGGRYDPALDRWTPISIIGAPVARGNHTAIWTGAQMIVWGGETDGGIGQLTLLNSGGSYDPSSDTWTAIDLISAPPPTRCHAAIWTGAEMLVFGGQGDTNLGCGGSTTNGLAAYDPATDTWTTRPGAPVASSFSGPRAIWTGSEMIVWFDGVGARYDVASDQWRGMDMSRAPSPRRMHTLLWTGSQAIVWGGVFAGTLGDGGIYNSEFDQTP